MARAATGGVLLLVEDEDAIGRLVKAYLEQQDGWTVVWVRTGEDAVGELRRHPVRLVVLDIWKHIGPADQAYFRQSRETRFGTTLEDVVKDREAQLPAFRASLDPLRRTVERQDFVCGAAPAYADYIVFGAFQWARSISDFELLTADDPVYAWRGRMLDLFDGLARRSPGYGG